MCVYRTYRVDILPKRLIVTSENFLAFNTSRSAPIRISTNIRKEQIDIERKYKWYSSPSFCLLLSVGFPINSASF